MPASCRWSGEHGRAVAPLQSWRSRSREGSSMSWEQQRRQERPCFECSSPEPRAQRALREHTEDAPNWGSCRQIQERGRVNAGRRETHPSCHEVVGREAFYMGSVVEFLDLQKLLGQACVVG